MAEQRRRAREWAVQNFGPRKPSKKTHDAGATTNKKQSLASGVLKTHKSIAQQRRDALEYANVNFFGVSFAPLLLLRGRLVMFGGQGAHGQANAQAVEEEEEEQPPAQRTPAARQSDAQRLVEAREAARRAQEERAKEFAQKAAQSASKRKSKK